jgi:hypothetical protein
VIAISRSSCLMHAPCAFANICPRAGQMPTNARAAPCSSPTGRKIPVATCSPHLPC